MKSYFKKLVSKTVIAGRLLFATITTAVIVFFDYTDNSIKHFSFYLMMFVVYYLISPLIFINRKTVKKQPNYKN